MGTESLATDKLVGQVLANRYEILHRLGEGAMGVVYKARHVKVGRPFAVKVLHARLLQDSKVAQRFEREAELAGRLHHANVVGVVDVGEVDGLHYMVMDFAEGPDLAQLLQEAPMRPERIINLVRQLLEGLFHAHEQGLIHRDFKPENVIVERDGHGGEIPRIVDFGIALLRETEPESSRDRLTTSGLVLGTPHYMAPEQAVADPIDHRIDLFALGIVVYEMLSGRLPFDGHGAEVARANLLLDPPPIVKRVPYLEVDPLLEAFARLLMAKKREARPATAKEARELLDLIERDRPLAAAALGVPAAGSARGVAATQPVATQAGSDTGTATKRLAAEPFAAIQSAVAVAPDAPGWYQPPSSLPPDPPAPQADPGAPRARQESTDLRAPLDWPPTRPPNRRRLVIGGVALVAGAVVATVIATSGRDQEPPRVATPIAVADKPAQPGSGSADPTPTEPAAAPPDAMEAAPVEPGSAAPPPPVDQAGPGSAGSAAISDPPPRKPTPRKKPPPPPRPEPRPAQPEPKPATSPVAPPGSSSISPADLSALYYRVGREVGRVPKDQADELWSQFRRFNIQELMASPPATRDAAAARLKQLLAQAASLR